MRLHVDTESDSKRSLVFLVDNKILYHIFLILKKEEEKKKKRIIIKTLSHCNFWSVTPVCTECDE